MSKRGAYNQQYQQIINYKRGRIERFAGSEKTSREVRAYLSKMAKGQAKAVITSPQLRRTNRIRTNNKVKKQQKEISEKKQQLGKSKRNRNDSSIEGKEVNSSDSTTIEDSLPFESSVQVKKMNSNDGNTSDSIDADLSGAITEDTETKSNQRKRQRMQTPGRARKSCLPKMAKNFESDNDKQSDSEQLKHAIKQVHKSLVAATKEAKNKKQKSR